MEAIIISKKSKLLIFALMAVFLLSLGVACAAEDGDVVAVSDDAALSADDADALAEIPTSNMDPAKKNTVITVEKKFTRVANDYNAGERGAKFYAVLTDSDGKKLANKNVQIAVNGPIYNVTTDSEGRAGLDINLAHANVYTYALTFSGDDSYNAAPIASAKLTVTKKTTSIQASNANFKASAKTKAIPITLKVSKNPYDGKTYLSPNKKITLKVDKKTYTGYTNKKGAVKIKVTLSKKGKYSAVIKFAGDDTYEACSKTIKINIK